MVKVHHILLVVPFFVQGALSRAQAPVTSSPGSTKSYDYNYEYTTESEQYHYTTDYTTKAYMDYSTTDYPDYSTTAYPDYSTTAYPDYSTTAYPDYSTTAYPDYSTTVYPDYSTTAYPDYSTTAYPDYSTKAYLDYVTKALYSDYTYTDKPFNSFEYYQYYDDTDDDYIHDYGEYYGFGNTNSPLDTVIAVYDEVGLAEEMPWVYVIVPVLQVDLFYVDDEQRGIENIDIELPIETFLFELGEFGLGHFELGDFGLSELQWDDHFFGDYGLAAYDSPTFSEIPSYEDYPIYGHYPSAGIKPDRFDSADELDDEATLDYPSPDYQPLWVDWVFMVPPGPEVDVQ